MAVTSVRVAGWCVALAAGLAAHAALRSTLVANQSHTPQRPQSTFTAGVDVVEMDVSVLDKNHKPVRGLTAKDFTILEDGKPQKIVAFSEEHAPAPASPAARWMRDVPQDVQSNDVADKQLFVIVLDDATLADPESAKVKPAGLQFGSIPRVSGGGAGAGGRGGGSIG